MKIITAFIACAFAAAMAQAKEYHVAVSGNDAHPGTAEQPFRTIQRGAEAAQPGDTITVHEGLYREWVSPPRGGASDDRRITYRAAPGEKVEIRGSEPVTGWERVRNDAWKVTLPNSFFGGYNPFKEEIRGDWFKPVGRKHHLGAVYLDGEWLVESPNPASVLAAETNLVDKAPFLLNLAWFRPVKDGAGPPIRATAAVEREGTRDDGDQVTDIAHGNWLRFDVDFGEATTRMELHGASGTRGAMVEIRLDSRGGPRIGLCRIPHTGGWQEWTTFTAEFAPVRGPRKVYLVFKEHVNEKKLGDIWYADVDETNTTIWAQFPGIDPNERLTEINARRSVFYPEQPGRNYITVRGFTMRQAAPPWAPPTAEQVGLIGTHWSKGWIIEDNTISHSVCVGLTLGKFGDEWDNREPTAQLGEGARTMVRMIERGIENGWNKEQVGGHLVRNNHISHCEQAGIVGCLGAAFSVITGNTIRDCYVRELFDGAEMAGIKLHGAVDVEISHNHIYRIGGVACIWLDWLAQGARVTGNLFHGSDRDLFLEVNHGPLVVDNNICLSHTIKAKTAVLPLSQGSAFAHNLFLGQIVILPRDRRQSPYLVPHGTAIAGFYDNPAGDDRHYNNIMARLAGLADYEKAELPLYTGGNVFLKGAQPSPDEHTPLLLPEFDPEVRLVAKEDGFYLEFTADPSWAGKPPRQVVTTELLGETAISKAPFNRPDGSPLRIDHDYFGNSRDERNPFPGPFETVRDGRQSLKVWPKDVNAK